MVMAQQVKLVTEILVTGRGDEITLQSDLVCFVMQLVGSVIVRTIHSVSQAAPQLGERLRMEGNVVGFFGIRDIGSTS